MTSETVIKVTDLKKSYAEFEAVRGISFTVKKGEVFGILGPNGAGKTTTLEMMEGLRDITGGSVSIAGIDVAENIEQIKEIIGVQPQNSAFLDEAKLTELIGAFASMYGTKVNAIELLEKVGLEGKAKSYAEKLSGGQRQRFSIAVALVHQPKVLFLDEPTTGLDPQARRNLWDLVKSIRDGGVTVILTTHYMEEAQVLCDRIAIMDEGKIVALDTPESLIDALLGRGFKPHTKVQAASLEDVFIDLTGKDLRE
ncbi:ABC transporter ATP-binding protein [Candidatus Saccharibacteria bacterium]|nr:ABC transporter ATP-binding protein [Candidatus Saccharibacteria bacterium]